MAWHFTASVLFFTLLTMTLAQTTPADALPLRIMLSSTNDRNSLVLDAIRSLSA